MPAIIGFAADGVEQAPQHERAEKVADGDDREVVAGVGLDVKEGRQDLRVAERDRVVEECLADEQGEAEHRAPWVSVIIVLAMVTNPMVLRAGLDRAGVTAAVPAVAPVDRTDMNLAHVLASVGGSALPGAEGVKRPSGWGDLGTRT